MKHYDKLIFELSRPGRRGYELPANEFKAEAIKGIPADLQRHQELELPEVSELDTVRHYTNKSLQ